MHCSALSTDFKSITWQGILAETRSYLFICSFLSYSMVLFFRNLMVWTVWWFPVIPLSERIQPAPPREEDSPVRQKMSSEQVSSQTFFFCLFSDMMQMHKDEWQKNFINLSCLTIVSWTFLSLFFSFFSTLAQLSWKLQKAHTNS